MGKGQPRHQPLTPGSPFARDHQAIQEQRSRLAEEIRSNHELLQEIKDQVRDAREAAAELSAVVNAWDARREQARDEMRATIREVIRDELARFKQSIGAKADEVQKSLHEMQETVSAKMTDILGYAVVTDFVSDVAREVTALLLADLATKKNGDMLDALIIEFIKANAK